MPKAHVTHCKNGHELSGDNVYLGTRGRQRCRVCRNAWERGRRALALPPGRPLPAACRHGHLMSGDNLRIERSGKRRCRACASLWTNRRRAGAILICERTTCRRGHVLTPENTKITSTGGRSCKTCETTARRERRRLLRALAPSQPTLVMRDSVDLAPFLVKLRDGSHIDDIADEIGVHPNTLRQWLRHEPEWQAIKAARPSGQWPNSPWVKRTDEIIALYPLYTPRDIAKRMGITLGSVSGRLHRLKVAGVIQPREALPKQKAAQKPKATLAFTTRRSVPQRPKLPSPTIQHSPAPFVAEKRGTPGIWQPPVPRSWSEIQCAALRLNTSVESLADLPRFNRTRVERYGLPPLAVARGG
jgi:hypothetical protein